METDNAGLDRMEKLIGESLRDLGLAQGLVEKVMSSLPSRDQMRPALSPSLGAAFAITSVVFASSPWTMDLPRRLGEPRGLAVAFLAAAFGAAVSVFALVRESLPRMASAAKALVYGAGNRPLAATAAAAAVLGAAWACLGWFPQGALPQAFRAARSSMAALAAVLAAAAALQVAVLVRPRDARGALKLLEAVSFVAACVTCVANYIIFVA